MIIEEIWDEEKQEWIVVPEKKTEKYRMTVTTKKGEAIIEPLALREAVRFHKCIAIPKELQKLMVVTDITQLKKVV